MKRIVIVAPHPDDEVFGAGGLIQRAHRLGVELLFIAVTDGEGSHPDLDAVRAHQLADRRMSESVEALRRLGCTQPRMQRLHIPDGQVSMHRSAVLAALSATLRPGDGCVAPWRHDGHPDHDACGDVAQQATQSRDVRHLSYLVWTWHWASPDDASLPWESSRQLRLTDRERARKRWAIMAFTSQTSPRGPGPSDEPVLPAPILRRFYRPYEVYFDEAVSRNDID